MKITFTDEHGAYTIERECNPDLVSVLDGLIAPVLLAAGYSETTIDKYLRGGVYDDRRTD